MFSLGIMLCITLLVVLFKTGHFRKLLPHHAWIDIVVTLFLMYALGDSVTGFSAAVVAGLVFSLFMWFAYRVSPSQRRIKALDANGKPYWMWVEVQPPGLFRR